MPGDYDGTLQESNNDSSRRSGPLAKVASALTVALLLLIDLLVDVPRVSMRLHLALEVGATVVALIAAGHDWARCAWLAARSRWQVTPANRASPKRAYIDRELWRAIESAIRAESVRPIASVGGFVPGIFVPPPPPDFASPEAGCPSPPRIGAA
jgi:hypothetical protein